MCLAPDTLASKLKVRRCTPSALPTVIVIIIADNPQEILMAVATSHEKSWRLSTSAKAWSVDKSKEIRNMLRHINQALCRTTAGGADRPANVMIDPIEPLPIVMMTLGKLHNLWQ